MARDVFISYSQPDRQCAFALTEYLEARGITVWIAPRDVSPAAEWAAEIIDAIAAAKLMVLVFSSSSNSSPQVRREVERAVSKDRRVLPFRIEDVQPSKSLEYFLSSHHWLDGFPPPQTPHFARLCEVLKRQLDAPAAAATRIRDSDAPSGSSPSAPVTALSSSDLRRVEGHLARAIGPIARILVERAAGAASDLEELERQLAAEIDSSADRRRFLEACQWSRRQPQ